MARICALCQRLSYVDMAISLANIRFHGMPMSSKRVSVVDLSTDLCLNRAELGKAPVGAVLYSALEDVYR